MKIILHWILTFQKVPDSAAQSLPRSEIVTGVPSSDDGVESAKEDEEFDQNGKSNDAVKLPVAVTSEKEKWKKPKKELKTIQVPTTMKKSIIKAGFAEA